MQALAHWRVGVLVLLLAACQTMPSKPSAWQAGKQEGLHFNASGRLAVKQQDKGSYANFDWDSNGTMQTLSVNTPLGNSVGQLCQDAQGVVATASNGDIHQAADASELSERLLGFAIPVAALDLWAHGYWQPDEAYRLHDDGRLEQAGWLIERQVDEQGQPRLLWLHNQQLSIRLVFSQYQAHSDNDQSHCAR